MSSNARKIVVHESEKSQKVQMLNWIQDALYKKSQRNLSQCEKTVVGRITVDQKLLYKRHNTKLTRSKLTFARITGNQEMEKEILGHVSFNTDVGREGEHDVMLQRIWTSGSQKFENIRRLRSNRYNNNYSSQFKLRIRSLKEDDCREEELEESCVSRPMSNMQSGNRVIRRRPHTAAERVTRPKSNSVNTPRVIQFTDEQAADQRPESCKPQIEVDDNNETEAIGTSGCDVDPEANANKITNFITHPEGDQLVDMIENGDIKTDIDKTQNDDTTCTTDLVVKTSDVNLDKIDDELMKTNATNNFNIEKLPNEQSIEDQQENINFENEQSDFNGEHSNSKTNEINDIPEPGQTLKTGPLPARPHTVMGDSNDRVQIVLPSRMKSAPYKTSKRLNMPIFLESERKPSLLELHKQRIKEANFESKIHKFAANLSDITVKGNNAVDYYTRRLQSDTQKEEARKRSQLQDIYQNLVSTTEGERRRWKGNPDIRSMTTKTLDLDFKNRPSTYVDWTM